VKIAIVVNRESRNAINLFGVPNREKYGQKAIACSGASRGRAARPGARIRALRQEHRPKQGE